LVAFFFIGALAYAIIGIWPVLAYYFIGGLVGLYVVCVRDRRFFLWRGMFCRKRALSHGIVVMFLWPFEFLDAVGFEDARSPRPTPRANHSRQRRNARPAEADRATVDGRRGLD